MALGVILALPVRSQGQATATYGVAQEFWSGLSTNEFGYELGAAFLAGPPTTNRVQANFSVGSSGNAYGQRLRSFLLPPMTGPYVFWISSDDWSELYLSSDETPQNRVRIAHVPTATPQRDFAALPSQQSAPITLQGGRRYFIEAIHREGTGADHIDVRWQLPDDTLEQPIASRPQGRPARLLPFRTNVIVAPAFLIQPVASLSVLEGRVATLSLVASNQSPITYQWQQEGVNIPGATQPVLTIPVVSAAEHNGKKFRCIASNSAGDRTSAETTLLVLPDSILPGVLSVAAIGQEGLLVAFTETVKPVNLAQFEIEGVSVLGVEATLDPTQIILRTALMAVGANHVLKVSGVQDLAGNTVAVGTQVPFQVQRFYSASVGATSSLGTVTAVGDGFDIEAGGRELALRTDQFLYQWALVTGDFDYQVRVESFELTDLLAKAGIMARDDLTSTGRYAAVLTTPSLNGIVFQSRTQTGRDAVVAGSGTVNYPNTWLRLQRQGNQLSGYSSTDSRNWTMVGSATIPLPEFLYVGLVANSRNTNETSLVKFRSYGDASGQPLGQPGTPDREPPGPSSRRTGLVISEIMYRPGARTDQRDLEYVEIFNSQPFFEDLSGHRLTGDIDYTFPTNSLIKGGGYVVVAKSPADMLAVYGLAGVLGPYSNSIPNNLGAIRLLNEIGGIIQEVEFESQHPWPVEPDGTGHSLVLARPSMGEGGPRGWAASDAKGGSPGALDGVGPEALRGVVINEFMANPGQGQSEFVELFNTTSTELDLSGAYLSDSATTNKFRIPAGTRISARGHLSFTGAELGFSLSSLGESLFLVNAANSRVLDAIRFDGSASGVSQGRTPDGEGRVMELATVTPGRANGARRIRDVVISEIMYAPASGDNDDEFIELYNRSNQAVSLAGWRLDNAITFTFPAQASIGPRGYIVVAKNLARALANHSNLSQANTYGNYGGTLANSGDRIQLFMAEPLISTNGTGLVTTNIARVLVNEVAYADGGRWGEWADGGGSSLELIDLMADNSQPSNWADSDESRKAPWTNVEFTGRVDLGGMATPAELHVFLQDMGEALVDDVEVFVAGGTNLLRNPGFEAGFANWFVQGTHEESTLDTTEGYNSRQSLHIRASARGDNGGNRIRTAWSAAIANNAIATIRAKVRWLAGTPHILLRLRGNFLECPGYMTLPRNLGTPGAPNSRAASNAGPAIHEVTHSPILPAANQPVTVTARAEDPDGVASFTLRYRIDTAAGGGLTDVSFRDDGAGGDAIAGDGRFSAVIPGQPGGTLVAFHMVAVDGATAPATSLLPNDAPARECLVRFGEPQIVGSAFGSYRFWCTAATVTRWRNRGKQSNQPLDCTFVYGNYRVIYNATTLYSGSPWHTPGYSGPAASDSVCDYVLHPPADDLLLGAEDFVVASVGNTDNDASKLAEQSSYWIARKMGIPYNHRRYIFVYFNGGRRASSVYEGTQQPSSDVIAQYWPDDTDGPMHKIEDWFEFDDSGDNKTGNVDATLDEFLTLGGKKTARYRVCWRPRAIGAGDDPNDFSDLFKAVDALGSAAPEPYDSALSAIVNMDSWLRVFAMQHIVGNWDAYGYNRGKNMYAYKPTRGGFNLLLWDIDFDLGSGGDGPTTDLFVTNEPRIARLYTMTKWRRMYLRICQEAANGPLRADAFAPTLDAKFKALVDNGATPASPNFIKDYVRDRRNYILNTAIPRTNFVVYGTNFVNTNINFLILTGAAPVEVESIAVNGRGYPVTWGTSGSRPIYWSIRVPLEAGTNDLQVEAMDRFGNVVSNGVRTLTVVSDVVPELPEGNVVFSEISYSPLDPASGFVEIHNRSTRSSFPLAGWRLSGVDFDFPEGSLIGPLQYLVVAKDQFAFGANFAFRVPVIGEFPGNLDPEGEVLSLLRPAAVDGEFLVVDRVRYEAGPPWPVGPTTDGLSVELVDNAQDNSRSSNWQDAGSGWRLVTVTGQPTSTNLFIYLTASGDVYLDDLSLVAGDRAGVGDNLIINGDFEQPLSTGWRFGVSHNTSLLSQTIVNSGTSALQLRSSGAGSASTNGSMFQLGVPVIRSNTYTLSFWLRYGDQESSASLIARFNPGGTLGTTQLVGRVFGTPGQVNSKAGTVAPYPELWLNEINPFNTAGIADPQGDRDPWLELHNPGGTAISLQDYSLSDGYSDLAAWAFPTDTVINPGEFKLVWLDGDADVTTAQDLHTSFRAQPTGGSVVLSRRVNGQVQIIDHFNYTGIQADESYGSFPDAQPFFRPVMPFATPRAANNGSSRPLSVRINEWMASNTGFIRDDADVPPAADDWFELYNPDRTDVDLGGYYLTDSSTSRTQYRIPAGTLIPAGGYLLVWADGSPAQNSTNSADIHVNFALARTGEEIGLYGADGVEIDLVRFGSQTNNISEGRLPDGGNSRVFFTQPTPRTANRMSGNNTPPILARIGNKITGERARLTLDLSATDAEENGADLVFSLAPGAPAGSSLTPEGRFVWRPSEAQGPGVFPVTFLVNDNGSPSLQASETINITVREVNLPPVFVDLRTRVVKAGETLSFATAVDFDLPAQAVAYRLESEPVEGLSLNPTTGILTWRPGEAHADRTHSVTIAATDNGVPNLVSRATYSILVYPSTGSVLVLRPSIDGAVLVLRWDSSVGDMFQAEYLEDIGGAWKPLGGVVTAAGATTEARDGLLGNRHRFYRVRKL